MEKNVKVGQIVQNVLKNISFILTVSLLLGFAVTIMAGEKAKGVKSLSQEEQIKLAQSAAPPHISKDATIMVMGADGKMIEARKGTNGFTCIPDMEAQEEPDPICLDPAGWQWLNDAMAGKKPTNTVPGIAYMGKGGFYWEKDGKVTPTTKKEPGAKRVKDVPHWMILGPFDSKASSLPSMPNKEFKTWVMYDGTPYSHLMIYQDPKGLK